MQGIELSAPLGSEDLNVLVDSIARKIVNRGLEAPAVFLLEMNKPLTFLASQSLLVAMPVLAAFVGPQKVADLSRALADRANVDLLIDRIEEMATEKDASRRAPADGRG